MMFDCDHFANTDYLIDYIWLWSDGDITFIWLQ